MQKLIIILLFFSQFQKEYPDIYSRRFPTTESEAQLFADKPKIKPPMLLSIKKAKTFSIRNWIPLKWSMNSILGDWLSLKTSSWFEALDCII